VLQAAGKKAQTNRQHSPAQQRFQKMPRTLRATVLSGAALQQNPGDKKNHPHNSRNQGALPTKKNRGSQRPK
jgi:hypothetical protein